MESKNRNVWIILAVIVVVLCCCVLAVAAATVGLFATQPLDWTGATSLQRERSERWGGGRRELGQSPVEVGTVSGIV